MGNDKVVDDMIMSFTHDVPMQTFLPGVPATGRPVRQPVVVVIYWDQASLLAQVGLIDEAALPVTGAIQAAKVLDRTCRQTPSCSANRWAVTDPGGKLRKRSKPTGRNTESRHEAPRDAPRDER